MGLKVLIADDEEDLVDVLRDRLEAYGFTVITAGTGREALAQIAVADTGPGITAEEATKIFEPFYQVAHLGTQRPHGTGLGLAISKVLVEMQRGRLWVESVVGRGSTFYFTLPVLPPVTATEAANAEGCAWG